MNRDDLEEGCIELEGRARRRWWKLAVDEVDRIDSDREVLIGRIQKRYGHTREEAEREAAEWLKGDAVGRP
jgi:uncharacterized protein YjbJ (UPF0337 family)